MATFTMIHTYIRGFAARLTDDERGATAVEYGLMVALIAAVIILAVLALGSTVKSTFSETSSCLAAPDATNCQGAGLTP